jgi:hypothetical protein
VLFAFSAYSTVKMEAMCSSETSVFRRTKRCYNLKYRLFMTTVVGTSNPSHYLGFCATFEITGTITLRIIFLLPSSGQDPKENLYFWRPRLSCIFAKAVSYSREVESRANIRNATVLINSDNERSPTKIFKQHAIPSQESLN